MITSNKEVFFNKEDIFVLDEYKISQLIACAQGNERKTARICMHKSADEQLHQMIIVHFKGNYVRPHRHPAKIESFHLIKGSLLVGVFDEAGNLTDRMVLDDNGDQPTMVARIARNIYHTVIPLTKVVIFHEITNGPFTGHNDSEFAEWAPEPDDKEKIRNFLRKISLNLI